MYWVLILNLTSIFCIADNLAKKHLQKLIAGNIKHLELIKIKSFSLQILYFGKIYKKIQEDFEIVSKVN